LRDDGPMSGAEIDEAVGRLSGRLGFAREQAGRPPRDLRAVLAARAADANRVAAARGRLLAGVRMNGLRETVSALRVLGFPARQVILLDEKRAYEVARDEEAKLL